MKVTSFLRFASFGASTILLRRKQPILGTIILTDKCNLSCRHCAVNNITAVIYPYRQIVKEMKQLYKAGIRILFFCGGETFLWRDSGKSLRNLVQEAKAMGFLLVNVVTNGTFPLDLPEADLILVSLDGGRRCHNEIRGDTFEVIMANIRAATADNICLYMAINRINRMDIPTVCHIAKEERNIRAVSFNFHTPYPGTKDLSLTRKEKQLCCNTIRRMIAEKCPVFNLRSAFRYIVSNRFTTPCHQCVVMENGKLSTCGRCVDIAGLCEQCGYFFAAEYSLVFHGNVPVMWDMLCTYLRYI